jgi:hypothetical protein
LHEDKLFRVRAQVKRLEKKEGIWANRIGKKKSAKQWSNEIGRPANGNFALRQVLAPDEVLKPGIWTTDSLLCCFFI